MSRPALIAVAAASAAALLLVIILRTPETPPAAPRPTASAPLPSTPPSPLATPTSPLARPPSLPAIPTSADPAALAVHGEVLRTLDRLAAPIAIHGVACPTPTSCDVDLEAKSRAEAATLIDRLSEPQSGLALEYKSMKLHAVTEDPETGLVHFGFTLER